MFDFDVGKILAVAVVALIVVGPKDLPRVLVRVARTFGTVRRAALQFRRHAMDMINEADLDGVKKELTPLNRSIAADFAYNAKTAMRGHLPKTAVAQEEASSAAATAAAKVAGVTYSSPEMREYMSTSPSPAVDANAGSSPACGVAKTEPAEPSAAEATQTEIPIADWCAVSVRLENAVADLDRISTRSDKSLLAKVRELVVPAMETQGRIEAWIVDDRASWMVRSTGVARQYCGRLGKTDNC